MCLSICELRGSGSFYGDDIFIHGNFSIFASQVYLWRSHRIINKVAVFLWWADIAVKTQSIATCCASLLLHNEIRRNIHPKKMGKNFCLKVIGHSAAGRCSSGTLLNESYSPGVLMSPSWSVSNMNHTYIHLQLKPRMSDRMLKTISNRSQWQDWPKRIASFFRTRCFAGLYSTLVGLATLMQSCCAT